MKIAYEFMARDYNQEGELILEIDPEYEVTESTIWVNNPDGIKNDQLEVDDIKTMGPLF